MCKIITVTLNPCIDRTIELGDLNIGGVNRVVSARVDAGGKGINVSRTLAGSEYPSVALGAVGGFNGGLLKELLTNEGVFFDFIDTDANTRRNIKIVNLRTKETTDINESGDGLSAEDIAAMYKKLEEYLPKAELLILSGSLPKGADTGLYADMISFAKERGVKTILDADGEALRRGIEAKPFGIKPNRDEFCRYLGKEDMTENEIIAGMCGIGKNGVDLVMLSVGRGGALVLSGGRLVRAFAPEVGERSTVGCGDAFVGAAAYACMKGYGVEDIARIAVAAGTLTAAKEGTKVCSVENAEQMKDNIRVKPVPML